MTSQQDTTSGEGLFQDALNRYQSGAPLPGLLEEFEAITRQAPRQAAGWTCLAWLQLLLDQPMEALRSARTAVRLNPQDPQARINLSLAMLETGAKGVREHVDLVRRLMAFSPELAKDLSASMADGLSRRPGWPAMVKLQGWLA